MFAALELADEYGIKLWIAALLDPEEIQHGTSDPAKYIQSPPPFEMKEMANGYGRTPEKSLGRRSTRGTRSVRSESPAPVPATKSKTPRKMATPRKPRNKTRGREEESVNGDKAETVKIEVETTVVPDAAGEEQVESTKVHIEMPARHPDLKMPKDAEQMIEKAREMVREANAIGEPAGGRKTKRKAADLIEAGDDTVDGPASKRQRPVEVDLRREKIRRRALTGVVGSLAIGYVSSFQTLFHEHMLITTPTECSYQPSQ